MRRKISKHSSKIIDEDELLNKVVKQIQIIDERELLNNIIDSFDDNELDELLENLISKILVEIYRQKFNKFIRNNIISED